MSEEEGIETLPAAPAALPVNKGRERVRKRQQTRDSEDLGLMIDEPPHAPVVP